MQAVGDAGPYGGIDESAPVFEGAPMRAVGDAGPYAVRHRRAEHGSGSGERRTSDSMRNLFIPQSQSDKGNPKTIGFGRCSFLYFFRC